MWFRSLPAEDRCCETPRMWLKVQLLSATRPHCVVAQCWKTCEVIQATGEKALYFKVLLFLSFSFCCLPFYSFCSCCSSHLLLSGFQLLSGCSCFNGFNHAGLLSCRVCWTWNPVLTVSSRSPSIMTGSSSKPLQATLSTSLTSTLVHRSTSHSSSMTNWRRE